VPFRDQTFGFFLRVDVEAVEARQYLGPEGHEREQEEVRALLAGLAEREMRITFAVQGETARESAEFAREIIRQRQVRAMLTSGKGAPRGEIEAQLERDGSADIDGTKVSAGLWKAIRLFEPTRPEGMEVSIIQVGPRKSPTGASARLAERIGAEVAVAVSPPFWVESARMEIDPVRGALRAILEGRDGRDE